jgi:hypothetical protein
MVCAGHLTQAVAMGLVHVRHGGVLVTHCFVAVPMCVEFARRIVGHAQLHLKDLPRARPK